MDPMIKNYFSPMLICWNDIKIHLGFEDSYLVPPPSEKQEHGERYEHVSSMCHAPRRLARIYHEESSQSAPCSFSHNSRWSSSTTSLPPPSGRRSRWSCRGTSGRRVARCDRSRCYQRCSHCSSLYPQL